MMKTVTTEHGVIGCNENVAIIEQALREKFGFGDASYIMKAVAFHIWTNVARTQLGDRKTWGVKEIAQALEDCQARVMRLVTQTTNLCKEAA